MSNGCGCSKGLLKYIKPPYTKLFYAACVVHDDDYDRGGEAFDRKVADLGLFHRMLTVIGRQPNSPIHILWMVFVAMMYYASVRVFGWHYFNYKTKKMTDG
ncbi:class 1 isoprenoid biosynthesis enzyme [Prevotella bivia]|jgi:hypothetical protein|uniref:class 1 isoprenoid biosynthesis enzyme n=1 Tax=Prevotella bivia TaxID=28125 RepID=UPI00288AE85E|nr:class 1 isoprenoid biosynthesis enzyme [Prevotella bivia]